MGDDVAREVGRRGEQLPTTIVLKIRLLHWTGLQSAKNHVRDAVRNATTLAMAVHMSQNSSHVRDPLADPP